MDRIPRPWKVVEGAGEFYSDVEGENIEIPLCDIKDANGNLVVSFSIVMKVVDIANEHDSLVAEVAELNTNINILLEQEEKRQRFTDSVMKYNNELSAENERLKQENDILKQENDSLKKQVQILMEANNLAYKNIEQILNGTD